MEGNVIEYYILDFCDEHNVEKVHDEVQWFKIGVRHGLGKPSVWWSIEVSKECRYPGIISFFLLFGISKTNYKDYAAFCIRTSQLFRKSSLTHLRVVWSLKEPTTIGPSQRWWTPTKPCTELKVSLYEIVLVIIKTIILSTAILMIMAYFFSSCAFVCRYSRTASRHVRGGKERRFPCYSGWAQLRTDS